MAITVSATSVTTGEVVPDVSFEKTITLTSIGSEESVSGITKFVDVMSIPTDVGVGTPVYTLRLANAGDIIDIAVSGFAEFAVESTAPGVGLVGSQGRGVTPAEAFAEVNAMGIRAIRNTLVTMGDPIIYEGLPRVPMIHSAATAASETGVANSSDDPSDDDDDLSANLHRFKVGTLLDPGDTEYYLEDWEEVGGGLSWTSAYPYRPWVQRRVERLTDHTDQTYTRSLHFNNRFVEHMWLDLGAAHSELTVIVAAMFHGYRSAEHGHYVLDAGKATPIYEDVVDGASHHIDDGLDYRAAMIYKKNKSLSGTSDRKNIAEGVHIRASHDDARKPKVLFSVFNGDDSMHGYWDVDSHKVKYGKMQPKDIRRLVLGRARNRVDRDYCSDMTVFEVLVYTQALTWKQIKTRAKRLGGRYKMNKYWD